MKLQTMDMPTHHPSVTSRLFWIAAPQFWANRAAPALMLLVILSAVVARARDRVRILASLLIVLPAVWLGLVIGLVFA